MMGIGGMGVWQIITFVVMVPWAVLMFLAPFIWYGILKRSRRMNEQLDSTNQLLQGLLDQEGKSLDKVSET